MQAVAAPTAPTAVDEQACIGDIRNSRIANIRPSAARWN
jgi:hypothetical protein